MSVTMTRIVIQPPRWHQPRDRRKARPEVFLDDRRSTCMHASGAGATRPSASRPTYFPAPAPQTAAEVRFGGQQEPSCGLQARRSVVKRLFYHHNMHGTLLAVPEFLHGISGQLSVIRCVGGGVLQVLESVFDCCTTRVLGRSTRTFA